MTDPTAVHIQLPDGLDDRLSIEHDSGRILLRMYDVDGLALTPTEAHVIASAIEEAARRAK